jgi:hypothetical protein
VQGKGYERHKFEQLPAHLEEGYKRLEPGFTCFADFTQVILFALPDVAVAVQKTLMEGGVRKVASVWGEQLLAKMAVSKIANTTGDEYTEKRKIFTDMVEGEAWLDE